MSETATQPELSEAFKAFIALERAAVAKETEHFFDSPLRRRELEAEKKKHPARFAALFEEWNKSVRVRDIWADLTGPLDKTAEERFQRYSTRHSPENRDKWAARLARYGAREQLKELWFSGLRRAVNEKDFFVSGKSFEWTDSWVKEHAGKNLSAKELKTISEALWAKAVRESLEPHDIQAALESNPLLKEAFREANENQAKFQAAYLAGNESEADAFGQQERRLEWALLLAYHWPSVAELLKSNTAFRVPSAFAVNDQGGLLTVYGGDPLHWGNNKTRTDPATGKTFVERTAGGVQLRLFYTAIEDNGDGKNLERIRSLLHPRLFYVLVGTMALAQEDSNAGMPLVREHQGAFWYTPRRLARLLGYKDKESRARLKRDVESLMNQHLAIKTTAAGEDYTITAEGLLHDYSATMEPGWKNSKPGAKKRIRRARLMGLSVGIPKALRDGVPWFPLSSALLLPPEGIRISEWVTMGFPLFCALMASARNSRKKLSSTKNKLTRVVASLHKSLHLTTSTDPREQARALRTAVNQVNRMGVMSLKISEDETRIHYELGPGVLDRLLEIPLQQGPKKTRKRRQKRLSENKQGQVVDGKVLRP